MFVHQEMLNNNVRASGLRLKTMNMVFNTTTKSVRGIER